MCASICVDHQTKYRHRSKEALTHWKISESLTVAPLPYSVPFYAEKIGAKLKNLIVNQNNNVCNMKLFFP
jgi:hypothetical protein